MISVLIATKNRSADIISCVQSILNGTLIPMEIHILDQSDNNQTEKAISTISHKAVHYTKLNSHGKSNALNYGIAQTRGDILAFTDDDCIVSNTWINEIKSSFASHSDVSCVTGNTHPYGNIPLWACPPNISTKRTIFSKPLYHTAVGFGNNLAIRKSVLASIGLFKTWLGPGSISTNCEDGEIMLRILSRGYKILHNPKMIVFHNKKLNTSTLKTQNLSYVCGEMACYGYYALSGWEFATRVVTKNLADSFGGIKRIVGDVLKRKILRADDWTLLIITFITRIKGLVIGLFYYLKEVIFRMGETETLVN